MSHRNDGIPVKFWPSVISIWRSGIALGIAALIFLQQNSVGRREFDEYKQTSMRFEEDRTKRIEARLERIENKLDTAAFKIVRPTSPSGYVSYTNVNVFGTSGVLP